MCAVIQSGKHEQERKEICCTPETCNKSIKRQKAHICEDIMAKSPAWQRKEGKNPEGGLNEAGRRSLRRQGKNIKRPVSAKEAKKSPKAAARRKSFCKRMMGMKKKLTSKKTANDPNSRINKALRKWDC